MKRRTLKREEIKNPGTEVACLKESQKANAISAKGDVTTILDQFANRLDEDMYCELGLAIVGLLESRDKEIAVLKAERQKAAGWQVNRCACVFEGDETDPVTECAYHKEMREAQAQNLVDMVNMRAEITELVQQRITLLNDCAYERRKVQKLEAEIERLKQYVESMTLRVSAMIDQVKQG